MGVCVKEEWLRTRGAQGTHAEVGGSAEVKPSSGLQQRQPVRSEVQDQTKERHVSRGNRH
jgi:hypothetical protein